MMRELTRSNVKGQAHKITQLVSTKNVVNR